MTHSSSYNPDNETYTISLPPLVKSLLGIVGTLVLAWVGWASTTLLAHSTSITKTETKIERLPVIEQKLDLLLEERGIRNPNPSPSNKKDPHLSWPRNLTP